MELAPRVQELMMDGHPMGMDRQMDGWTDQRKGRDRQRNKTRECRGTKAGGREGRRSGYN